MRWMKLPLLVAVLTAVPLLQQSRAADDAALEPFLGTYIGTANAVDVFTGSVEERDLTIEVKPYTRGGLSIEWETIFKVDGRRDVPGVKRRHNQLIFQPSNRGDYYNEVPHANPFRERKEFDPIAGDAVRWAVLDGDVLKVYSVTVRDDGRYELEVYDRSRTEQGVDIAFQRLLDGTVQRRVTGRAVLSADEE